MVNNPLQTKSIFLSIIPGLFLLCTGLNAHAQGPPSNPGNGQATDPVISNVQIKSGNTFCAGAQLEFSFDVQNGNDKDFEYFTANTTYTIQLQYIDGNDGVVSLKSKQFQSQSFPTPSNFALATIQDTIIIPDYSPSFSTYQLVVTSINPAPISSAISTSNFEVKTQNFWTGAVSSQWKEQRNWDCNLVPTIYSEVFIPSGLTNYPILNTGAVGMANDLIIEPGASVTITNDTLQLGGSIVNNGILNAQNGSLTFIGTAAQTLPAGSLLNDRIANLTVDNSAGLTLEGPVEVTGTVLAKTGNISSNGNLELISDATQTALIDGSGAGEVVGAVTMQRFLNNGFGYKYFSSPFQNTTVGDFSPFMDVIAASGFPHFYEYRENRKDADNKDLTGWQNFTHAGNTLNIGEGYALNLSDVTNPITIEISGIVNNGPVNVSLQNNNRQYTNGFNLIGNPYPSPIDWDVISPALDGIDNAIYFFTSGSDNRYTGTYTSYVNGVSTDGRSSNIIPSMQGFFVRVSNPIDDVYPATATLSFTNAVRTGNQVNQDFYKSKSKPVKPQIRITAGFANLNASDAAVIYFNSGATTEFDKDLDAFKLLNTAIEVPSLYSLTKTQQKLSINAVNSDNTQEIPLGVNTERSGKMFIKLANVENVFPSIHIYLKDQKNKIVHNLSENPEYSFTSQKGESNDRFLLLLSSEKFSATEMDLAVETFSVYSENGEILVKLNLPADTPGTVAVNNISGQLLQKKSAKEKEEIRFDGILSSGIYFVSLEWKNQRITKKILLKK